MRAKLDWYILPEPIHAVCVGSGRVPKIKINLSWNCLQAAIVYSLADRLEYVRMLLAAGSEVNHRDEANHNSMLNLLVKSKRLGQKVKFLLILLNAMYAEYPLSMLSQPQHFYRASAYRRAILPYSKSVCLSVRPSVRNVPVSDENGLTYRQFFHHIRQHNHSSFTNIKHLHEIPTGSPPTGALNTGGVHKFLDYSTNKSLHLTDDTRQRHSYYGRRIGTRMRSIKWCHFL